MTSDEILRQKGEEEKRLAAASTADAQAQVRQNLYQLEVAYQLAVANERAAKDRPLRKTPGA
jgi:prephenate dehydratase